MKCHILIILSLIAGSILNAQRRDSTTVYEFVDLNLSGDAAYIRSEQINDSIYVRQEFYGRRLVPTTITPAPADTFIIFDDRWKKILNEKVYSFLSKQDFDAGRTTVEYTTGESPPHLLNWYTPVKRSIYGSDTIYVYNIDTKQGEHLIYGDTRIYFSFRYGTVGYLDYGTQMLMKKFEGRIKMELRKTRDK